MEKRKMITIVGAACCYTLAAQQQERPNILWLTYEDTSPHFIGCYGNPQAKTPTIDRLASEGIRFEAAFATAPVSSAARFCLFTGVRPATMGTGHHRSRYPVPDFVRGFPEYLRRAGYYTTNNSKTDYNMAQAQTLTKKAWNECSNKADWRGRAQGQPFFAIYNSMSSHQSRTMTDPWNQYQKNVLDHLSPAEQTHGGALEMPLIYRDSPEMQRNLERVYNSITLTDKEFASWLQRLSDDGLAESTIVFCFSDHGEGIPRGKQSAVGMGFKVPFILYFPPKYAHLSPFGKAGIVTDQLISFEDLAPTVLSLCGVEIPSYMKGRPFAGQARQEARTYAYAALDRTDESSELSRTITDGRYLYTRVMMPFQPFLRWMSYTDKSDIQKQIRADYALGLLNPIQKSILEPRSCEYLYDLHNDKWEIHNLATDPHYKEIRQRMSDQLLAHLIEERDAHFIPEYTLIQRKKEMIPYRLRLDDSVYPAERVIRTAWLAGEGKKALPQQLQALTDSNPIVQYWGAMALFAQQESLRSQRKVLTGALAKITYDPARLVLGAVLANNLHRKEGEAVVREYIRSNNPELARMAMQLLISFDRTIQKEYLPEVTELQRTRKGEKEFIPFLQFSNLFVSKVTKSEFVDDIEE